MMLTVYMVPFFLHSSSETTGYAKLKKTEKN